jgi:hypothetical protein
VVAVMRPEFTPEERDDERFRQSYVAGSLASLVVVLVLLLPAGLVVWQGWTEAEALGFAIWLILAWAAMSCVVYVIWCHIRRRQRRTGGRR